tara:strand:+ start:948 stop:1232 length:285 start_codon:yes stop_codon:yes gene_type:complete
MDWKDIIRKNMTRLEKLRTTMRKYMDDEYVDWATDGFDESSVDEYIKFEIEELKANLATVPKDGNFSDGEDASDYIKSSYSLIKELEQILNRKD